ncbi:MAG: hypothetical protein NTZ56_18095 [Acidobacteria bacterium]|nr:hypothetical protein [Acidobacteriota bacterium]
MTLRYLMIALAIAVLTLLQFLYLPGHTYLQSDTQIYVPVFEHLLDPGVLAQDLLVTGAHLTFTIYDEVSIGLKRLTGADFEWVLQGQQLLFRALGLVGVFLIGRAAKLPDWAALLVAAISGAGATIMGPAVLSVEYEPVPRGYAIGLLLFSMGLAAHGHWLAAGAAGSIAVLYHAPAVWPFWLAALVFARRMKLWLPLVAAGGLLALLASQQVGIQEHQNLFSRLAEDHAQLQIMRASYNWVSVWGAQYAWHYPVACVVCLVALWRLGPEFPLRRLMGLMVLIGLFTLPASYLLLEQVRWTLMPQLQPMRALLYCILFGVILAGLAAYRTRGWERVLWLAIALYPAAVQKLPPPIETPALRELTQWARQSTPAGAVFLFPEEGRRLAPGVFRARALRALYVDWKAGGQVNYFPVYSREWWRRWNEMLVPSFTPERVPLMASRGIDYLVVSKTKLLGLTPTWSNTAYTVYRIR